MPTTTIIKWHNGIVNLLNMDKYLVVLDASTKYFSVKYKYKYKYSLPSDYQVQVHAKYWTFVLESKYSSTSTVLDPNPAVRNLECSYFGKSNVSIG